VAVRNRQGSVCSRTATPGPSRVKMEPLKRGVVSGKEMNPLIKETLK
jgi:hypothetical protein